MIPPFVHQYVQHGLAASPAVLRALVGGIPPNGPRWDARPQPERFSLREIVAHLADWEAIWLERIEQAIAQDNPEMQPTDPGQIAAERDYAHADPDECLARFAEGRARLAAKLAALDDAQWQRTISRPGIGPMSLDAIATLIVSHDGYHLKQVVEWLG